MRYGAQRRRLVLQARTALLASGLCAALASCNALWGLDRLHFGAGASGGSTSGGGEGPGGGSGGVGATGGAEGGGVTGGTGGAGATGGSATGGAAGAGGGAGGSSVFCAGTSLIACYEFEGDVLDGTGNGHDASAEDVSYGSGSDGLAIELDAGSLVTIPPSESFGPSELTIELWLRLAELPEAGTRMGVVDRNSRWALWIHDEGLRCTVSGSPDLTGPQLVAQTWTHVACTVDAQSRTLYVDGNPVASTGGASLDTTPTGEPLTIGSDYPSGDPLIGRVDGLRVFGVARSAPQICGAAGGSDC